MEWQPIETAPRDEDQRILVTAEGRVFIATFDHSCTPCWKSEGDPYWDAIIEDIDYVHYFATHWMPLPTPPKDTGE